MAWFLSSQGWTRAAMVGVLWLAAAASLDAQTDWVKRAREAARGTGLGTSVLRTAAEAQLLDATRISLDESGLATLGVGTLTLGVSAVEIRNGTALRLHAYLYNPGAQTTTVPLPDPELFVLVDGQGRRLQWLAGPNVDGLAEGAAEITVPALERVSFTLLYDEVAAGAQLGTLKVGELGMIPGIPLHTSASPSATGAGGGAGSIWTTPPAPPLPDTGDAGEPQPQPPPDAR
jgi:hypothetical protein